MMKELTETQKKYLLFGLCGVGIPLLLLASILWGNPDKSPTAQLRISEMMNHNRSVYADESGEYHDWVEVQNVGTYAVKLDGLSLTDDREQPDKYTFSDIVLKPNECITVHLTGNKKESRPLHASFGLSGSGDTVYLYDDDTLLDSMAIGESPENISYGIHNKQTAWFASPTPGSPNSGISAVTTEALWDACYTGVMINEVCAVSGNDDTDWVELFNTTDAPISLSGYRLTESPETEGFRFGDLVIPAGGYYTLRCDKALPEGDTPCAPFSLNRFGDTLYFYTPDGVLCDRFETGKQRLGVTSGRMNGDRSARVFFNTPTKGEANHTPFVSYAAQPIIQAVGGYKAEGSTVTITVPDECKVYYTTSGSVPTTASRPYTPGQAITLSKTCVLRAIAYRDGYLPSDVATQTYFTDAKHDIPVLSVSGNYAELFGPNGTFTRYNNENLQATVHAEYFTKDGTKEIEFDSILRIAGGLSRYNVQKAFSLKLNQTTGDSSVTYPFFEDTNRTTFGDLLLRPSGSDWSNAKLRDEFSATALKNTDTFVVQSARAVALYINGDYRGLYYLREKRNEEFISAYTGIPKERVQLVKIPARYEWNTPLDPDMAALIRYAQTHDLTKPDHYEYVMSRINAESLMRYIIAQTYFGNGDMINNIACYRDTQGGKWNWLIFDMDWACSSYYINHEFLKQLYEGTGKNTFQNYYFPLMTALLQNETFAQEFIKLYAEMMDTTLSAERLVPLLNRMADTIRSEIPRQQKRYGAPSPARFEQQVSYIEQYLKNRKATMTRQLKSVFSLTDAQWDALTQ